ncbi:hypothetical protein GCM10015535_54260 [Streptomyces gelaticus]|uniref:Uncharacterized protein n=1 Tax=Streptomyces gelaticus TaxID=285446 RepID=A0ABQ2W520_9ACTN|nr:hypothetical protein GCM10015535_54260 [Streptomyces gelaticus]
MVIIRPAVPSETAKSDPIDVSRPMGRISVVTIEKMPSITETTASRPRKGVRGGEAVPSEGAVAAVVVMADAVLCSVTRGLFTPVHKRRWTVSGRFATSTSPAGVDVAFSPEDRIRRRAVAPERGSDSPSPRAAKALVNP